MRLAYAPRGYGGDNVKEEDSERRSVTGQTPRTGEALIATLPQRA